MGYDGKTISMHHEQRIRSETSCQRQGKHFQKPHSRKLPKLWKDTHLSTGGIWKDKQIRP